MSAGHVGGTRGPCLYYITFIVSYSIVSSFNVSLSIIYYNMMDSDIVNQITHKQW